MIYKATTFCLMSVSCFCVEAERETILERMARVHIEHNLRFNSEYNRLREVSKDKVQKKKVKKGDGK